MATHSSMLAWEIPLTEEPCRLLFLGSDILEEEQSPWLPLETRPDSRGSKKIGIFLHQTQGRGFPGGSVVKNPHAMQETQGQSLNQKDPLEKGMATHSSVLAWRIP